MMRKPYSKKYVIGQRFGRLKIIEFIADGKNPKALCKCDCGTEKTVSRSALGAGTTVSCGCYQREVAARIKTTHGRTYCDGHKAWLAMWSRCTNPMNVKYALYGARGITVCDEWRSLDVFLRDMGPMPPGGSLERNDTNAGYFKANCRWATAKEQAQNRRTSRRWIVLGVEYGSCADAAEAHGMSRSAMYRACVGRIKRDGFDAPLKYLSKAVLSEFES